VKYLSNVNSTKNTATLLILQKIRWSPLYYNPEIFLQKTTRIIFHPIDFIHLTFSLLTKACGFDEVAKNMGKPRQHCKILLERVFFCFLRFIQHFANKPGRLRMNRWMKVQTSWLYAFYGAKMRNFGVISMSCLSSIIFLKFFGNLKCQKN
jgi:hypothetical protein